MKLVIIHRLKAYRKKQHAGVKWAFCPCWRTRCSITLAQPMPLSGGATTPLRQSAGGATVLLSRHHPATAHTHAHSPPGGASQSPSAAPPSTTGGPRRPRRPSRAGRQAKHKCRQAKIVSSKIPLSRETQQPEQVCMVSKVSHLLRNK